MENRVYKGVLREFKYFPKTIEDLDNKDIWYKIKYFIRKELGECDIYACGSRVNGFWVENSDYDVFVKNSKPFKKIELTEKIRKELRVKIDIGGCFYEPHLKL